MTWAQSSLIDNLYATLLALHKLLTLQGCFMHCTCVPARLLVLSVWSLSAVVSSPCFLPSTNKVNGVFTLLHTHFTGLVISCAYQHPQIYGKLCNHPHRSREKSSYPTSCFSESIVLASLNASKTGLAKMTTLIYLICSSLKIIMKHHCLQEVDSLQEKRAYYLSVVSKRRSPIHRKGVSSNIKLRHAFRF